MPKGVYIRTKQVWNKGKNFSDNSKLKMSIAHKGVKLSDETKKRMSVSRTGQPGHMLGHKHKEESKEKSRKTALEKGFGKWMTGKKHTAETRIKMSSIHKGENSSFWRKY
jgi:hypothetical protein